MGILGLKLKNRLLKLRQAGRELHPLTQGQLCALDRLDARGPARDSRFVVLDLETTGLDPDHDHVVAVGALRVVEGRVRLGDSFSLLVNPQREVSVESIKVHGIVPDMLADAPPAWQAFGQFLKYLGDDVLVAHNAAFDLAFINRVMRAQHGFPIQNLVIDTLSLCRNLILPSDPYGIDRNRKLCSLDSLAQRFKLDLPDRHTAMGDALATALILLRMIRLLEKKNRPSLGSLAAAGRPER
jgi:DNA polymerase-3 subunit epsilon